MQTMLTQLCAFRPHLSVGLIFFYFLHWPLSLAWCKSQSGTSSPHHTWAHAGLLPPMLLPPMPWESLVILSRGRGSGFSFCGISILHTPARQIKSSSGIKKSCASWHRDPWPSFSTMKTSGNSNIWGECNRCPWNSEVFPFNYTARNSGAHKVSVFAPLFALLLA